MFEQDSPDNNRVRPLAFDDVGNPGETLPGATLPVTALDLPCEPKPTHPQPSPVALDFPAGNSPAGSGPAETPGKTPPQTISVGSLDIPEHPKTAPISVASLDLPEHHETASVQAPPVAALDLPDAPKPVHAQTIQVGGLDLPEAPKPHAGTPAAVQSIQVSGLDLPTSPAVPHTPASQPPASLPPARPQAAFAVDEDPAILAGLRHFKEQFPDKYDQNESAMASRLRKLLPMSYDKISAFAENTVGHVGNMVQEITEATQNIAALSTADTVSGIINEAREAASMQATSGGHGLLAASLSAASLFKKLESKLRPFDPQAAANTLMRLYGGLKSIHSRVAGIAKTAGDLLPGVQLDIMAMSVIEYMAENTSFAPAAQHRHQTVLTLGIQLEMVTKQSENLLKQTETSMMQLEDVRNVTLPSLGFLVAVKNT
ncbi:hypothetical protein HAP94_14540 [Acidithiobacillus ferrivorans]|nr:hypothetical protein [Acidithiobacillus ferrivorans]